MQPFGPRMLFALSVFEFCAACSCLAYARYAVLSEAAVMLTCVAGMQSIRNLTRVLCSSIQFSYNLSIVVKLARNLLPRVLLSLVLHIAF